MLNLANLPKELSFLKWINADRNVEYCKSRYLINNFDDDFWYLQFGKTGSFNIDFNVKLENGSLLTAEANRSLLNIFKSWICIQTHYDITGGVLYAASSAYHVTRRVIWIIDYFLLNAEHFRLSEFGLTYITENDVINLMAQLASSNEIANSIYQWPLKLTEFLREEINNADHDSLVTLIKTKKFLALEIPDIEDRDLNLSDNEVITARAILWKNGFLRRSYTGCQNIESFKFCLNTEKLAKAIYANTLTGANSKPTISEFQLVPHGSYRKEYSRVSIRCKDDDNITAKTWANYKKTIRSLGQLAEIGAPVPTQALNPTNSLALASAFDLQPQGRYRTLPYNIVLNALRNAIEFGLNYGDDILESVISVIKASRNAGVSCLTFSRSNDIRPIIKPKIEALGVQVWHLTYQISIEESGQYRYKDLRPTSSEFFTKLRNNFGLYELLRIFFGSVQICLGTLMARRQGELIDLISGNALDENLEYLIFYNRKSGIGDLRTKEARPIPNVAVQLIEMLQRFHSKLIALGIGTQECSLFSIPHLHTGQLLKASHTVYNANLDIFCDYFETDLNENGDRYYIRQHQLRRFFAMMFFWGNAFGGMDALRWFLGHTDVEHLYHYITESTPGYILRSSKAQFVTDLFKLGPAESEESAELAELLRKHFGTSNFTIINSIELEEYIEDLLIENRLQIEPIFFEGPEGKTYRIAIRVLDKTTEP